MSSSVEAGNDLQNLRLSTVTTIGAIVMATSVAAMVAGEAGAGLVMLCWAIANLLGLPYAVFVVGAVVSALIGSYLAVVLFVRVYRIENRLAKGESGEDVGWQIFASK